MSGMIIGCHVSSSNGYKAMGETALSVGANTFQFFTRNPRGGAVKLHDAADAAALMKLMSENSFGKIVAHAPYTINLSASDQRVRNFARETFKDDLYRMESLPGNYYNVHPGSHVGQGKEVGMGLIADVLNESLTPEMKTTVLLETMAGKGTEIGSRFEEIAAIISLTELDEKVGVCLDTCHVFDGGYDIINSLDSVLDEFDRIIGISRLKAIHINDSMNAFGSHKDRHQKIGEGSIGLEAFERIINHPQLRLLPFILETPNELEGYAKEIQLLKSKYI